MNNTNQPPTTYVCLGENERAGLPIAAPTVPPHPEDISSTDLRVVGTIRWVQREHHFILQQYRHWQENNNGIECQCYGWVEVALEPENPI